jgi:hypothetical protein
MADKTVTIRVSAIDDATGTLRAVADGVDKVALKASRAAKEGGLLGGSGFDPFHLALRPKIVGDEAEIRKGMADFIRKSRDEAKAAHIDQEVHKRLFGDTAEIHESATRAGEVAARSESEGFLHELNKVAGKRGSVKEFTELLVGGGAVAGLTFAAHEIGSMAVEVGKLRDEFDEGKISAGQFVEKMAEGLPVLGSIRVAGLAIRELFTGEEADAARITEQAKLTSELIDEQHAAIVRTVAAQKDHLDLLRKINNETALIGLSPRAHQEEASAQQSADQRIDIERRFNDRVAEIEAERAAAAKKAKEATDVAIEGKDSVEERQAKTQRVFGSVGFRAIIGTQSQAEAELRRVATSVSLAIKQEQQVQSQANGEIVEAERQKQEALTALSRQGAAERQQIAIQDVQSLKDAISKALNFAGNFASRFAAGAAKAAAETVAAQQEAENTLLKSRLRILDDEAKSGDRAAAKEAERLRIAEDLNERKQELQKIIDSQNVSDDQRQRAREQQRQLDNLPEARPAESRQLSPTATLNSGRLITGEVSRQSDNFRERTAKTTEETTKLTRRIDRTLADMLLQLRKQGTSSSLSLVPLT